MCVCVCAILYDPCCAGCESDARPGLRDEGRNAFGGGTECALFACRKLYSASRVYIYTYKLYIYIHLQLTLTILLCVFQFSHTLTFIGKYFQNAMMNWRIQYSL